MNRQKLAASIDHTNLSATASSKDIKQLCHEARTYNFASVCINPYYIKLAKLQLNNYPLVKICTVIGFPLGAISIQQKSFEVIEAINWGANEIDIVINLGSVKDKNWTYLNHEINTLRNLTSRIVLKVIFETAVLTEEEIIKMCQICNNNQVDFVKTSTGFHPKGGATIRIVKLIKANVKKNVQIKASGGIHDAQTAIDYIKAGATRIGTSKGMKIMHELDN